MYKSLAEVKKALDDGKLLTLNFWDDYSEITNEKGKKIFQGYGAVTLLGEALDLLGIPWTYGDQKPDVDKLNKDEQAILYSIIYLFKRNTPYSLDKSLKGLENIIEKLVREKFIKRILWENGGILVPYETDVKVST
jgi:hypothetical protein